MSGQQDRTSKALVQASAAVLKRARRKRLSEASPLVASLPKQIAAVDIVLGSACPIWGQSRYLSFDRLGTYGLAEFQIEGDGNCQFRALADQIFRNPDYHKHVRKAVMKQLKEFRKQYESYVPMEYKVYLKKMKRSGEWGDHLTLQAAADRFGAKICLLTSFKDTCLIEIVPRDLTPTKELWLSFWCEVHYNSLYGIDDLLTRKAKKKHWLF
ncbi:unnamed protein product [Miscanthus lutarioriparius]|uniref:ubiquitinyl hydrolase 1 n=1 Tax=Miscanthus lutarioriparius TaxID=422564 RepID=A0A811SJ11_9POAL|nr:unnamed protein product [Miscanthus lutarioriparius]